MCNPWQTRSWPKAHTGQRRERERKQTAVTNLGTRASLKTQATQMRFVGSRRLGAGARGPCSGPRVKTLWGIQAKALLQAGLHYCLPAEPGWMKCLSFPLTAFSVARRLSLGWVFCIYIPTNGKGVSYFSRPSAPIAHSTLLPALPSTAQGCESIMEPKIFLAAEYSLW